MNKKIIILILAVFCIISTILVSVFGKVPEDNTRIAVESISFIDPTQKDNQCQLNENGTKIIYIERGTTQYQLHYVINPTDASEQEVYFELYSNSDVTEIATVSETGLITFYHEATVTVQIFSNTYDFKKDIVIIEFKGPGHTVVPDDDDPF